MTSKTNPDKTPDISSLLKNLENIKSEFVTLREYVGSSADELEEKISGVVEMLSRYLKRSYWFIEIIRIPIKHTYAG